MTFVFSIISSKNVKYKSRFYQINEKFTYSISNMIIKIVFQEKKINDSLYAIEKNQKIIE